MCADKLEILMFIKIIVMFYRYINFINFLYDFWQILKIILKFYEQFKFNFVYLGIWIILKMLDFIKKSYIKKLLLIWYSFKFNPSGIFGPNLDELQNFAKFKIFHPEILQNLKFFTRKFCKIRNFSPVNIFFQKIRVTILRSTHRRPGVFLPWVEH